jgi:predicted patatin/cPLA2 family phospholipase
MEAFKILCLGGGGIKGIMHIGALEELEKEVGPLHKHFSKGIYGCSVGSLIATTIAFGITPEQIKKVYSKIADFKKLVDMNNLTKIQDILNNKGIFSMTKFENILIKLFNEFNIDIKSKKCCDALVPLYISASNLSKGTPTLFTGNIPVLKAIMASCCLPFIFEPQIINNNIYIDGGFITNILLNLVPPEDRSMALSFSIIHTKEKIINLKNLSPLEYLYKLYKISCVYEHYKNSYTNNIDLWYDKGSGVSDFTEDEKNEMILIGSKLCRRFISQCANKKLIEI